MRTLLLLLILVAHPLQAADLSACRGSWRLGQRLVHAGDSVSRALDAIDNASHRLRWIHGPRGARWSLVETGRNRQTVNIRVRNGRIAELCRYPD